MVPKILARESTPRAKVMRDPKQISVQTPVPPQKTASDTAAPASRLAITKIWRFFRSVRLSSSSAKPAPMGSSTANTAKIAIRAPSFPTSQLV